MVDSHQHREIPCQGGFYILGHIYICIQSFEGFGKYHWNTSWEIEGIRWCLKVQYMHSKQTDIF